ncbi:diguanylate cyclase domain-containing protein [Vibrio sp. YIC-376]|uniref:diguanylate cyclase domain-containing protein n=1 Tax=Vibrio sp. YIC-376 TaxID=3136162 RepID=UPI00402AFD39
MSLRIKLIWPILVFIVAIFVVNHGYVYYTTHQPLQLELIKETRLLTHNISHSIKDALIANDKKKAETIVAELLTQKTIVSAQLYDRENKTIVLLNRSNGVTPIFHPDEVSALGYIQTKNYLYIVEPIIQAGNVVAQLGITLTNQPIVMNYCSFLKDIATLLIFLSISSVFFYIYIGRLILKPLLQLNGAVQDLTHEHTNYSEIRYHTKDEIGELISSFDRMVLKLLQRDKQRQHSLETLKQKSTVSNEVIESIRYALVITDNLGTIIHANSATYDMFNKNSRELLHTDIRNLISTKSSIELNYILDKWVECTEIKLSRIDNEQQYSLSSRFLSKQGYLLFEIRDITEIEAATSREHIAGRVFESSQDGLIVLNERGVITMVNPAVTKLLGKNIEKLVGHTFISTIRSPVLRKMLPSIIKSIENYGLWQGEVIEQTQSGQFIPMFAKVNRIMKCESNELYDSVIVLTDLSEAKEMERLEYLAHHDPLTGLANRSKFNFVLEELVQRSAYVRDEFAVIYLDLDGFKAINDTYGHDAGDEVLKVVAERMTSVTRHSDLIARLSGDEFVILINPANQPVVTRVSEQLLKSICTSISYNGHTLSVGVSIGVKLVGLNERDADRILKSADKAMYQAKKSGKGRAILAGYEL